MEKGLSQPGKIAAIRPRLRDPVPKALLWALSVLPLAATAPVPRESPDLQFLDASDNPIQLSSFKGKVVLLEFLLTNCPHCLRVAQMTETLNRELGPRGFQPIGIAFENGISGQMIGNFRHDSKVTYPLGYTSSNEVDRFLGRAVTERFQVPQIVLIGRDGVIRGQSRPVGERDLENETYLRRLIGELLSEGSPSWLSRFSRISPAAILVVLGGVLVWRIKQRRQRS